MAEDAKDAAPQDSAPLDPRDAFKAAIEKKRNRGAYGPGAAESSGSAGGGGTSKSGGRREFRRKSG